MTKINDKNQQKSDEIIEIKSHFEKIKKHNHIQQSLIYL